MSWVKRSIDDDVQWFASRVSGGSMSSDDWESLLDSIEAAGGNRNAHSINWIGSPITTPPRGPRWMIAKTDEIKETAAKNPCPECGNELREVQMLSSRWRHCDSCSWGERCE